MVVPAVFDAVQVTTLMPTRNEKGELMIVVPSRQTITGSGVPVAATKKLCEEKHSPGSLVVTIIVGHDVNAGGVAA